jgi:hypothetical protein
MPARRQIAGWYYNAVPLDHDWVTVMIYFCDYFILIHVEYSSKNGKLYLSIHCGICLEVKHKWRYLEAPPSKMLAFDNFPLDRQRASANERAICADNEISGT